MEYRRPWMYCCCQALSGSNPGNYLDYSYAQDYEIFKKQEFKSMKMSRFENVQEQSSNF